MKNRLALFVAAAVLVTSVSPVFAINPKAEQQSARKQMNDGKVLSLR